MHTLPRHWLLRFGLMVCVLEGALFTLSWILHATHPLYLSSIVLSVTKSRTHILSSGLSIEEPTDQYVNILSKQVEHSGAKYCWLRQTTFPKYSPTLDSLSVRDLFKIKDLCWKLYWEAISRKSFEDRNSCYRLTAIDSDATLVPIAVKNAIEESSEYAVMDRMAGRLKTAAHMQSLVQEYRQNGNEEAAHAVEHSIEAEKSSIADDHGPVRPWEHFSAGKELRPFSVPLVHCAILFTAAIGCAVSPFAKRKTGSRLNQVIS